MRITFYVKTRESRYLGNGTSDRNWIPKTLFNTKYPPKPGKNHLGNHFWPLKSGFSAIASMLCTKREFSQNPLTGRLGKFGFPKWLCLSILALAYIIYTLKLVQVIIFCFYYFFFSISHWWCGLWEAPLDHRYQSCGQNIILPDHHRPDRDAYSTRNTL